MDKQASRSFWETGWENRWNVVCYCRKCCCCYFKFSWQSCCVCSWTYLGTNCFCRRLHSAMVDGKSKQRHHLFHDPSVHEILYLGSSPSSSLSSIVDPNFALAFLFSSLPDTLQSIFIKTPTILVGPRATLVLMKLWFNFILEFKKIPAHPLCNRPLKRYCMTSIFWLWWKIKLTDAQMIYWTIIFLCITHTFRKTTKTWAMI